MSENTVAALISALRENQPLRERLEKSSDPQEFERLAAEAGFDVSSEEFFSSPTGELSDAELDNVSGGYTFPRTDWIYCDNPWTNAWCTLKC